MFMRSARLWMIANLATGKKQDQGPGNFGSFGSFDYTYKFGYSHLFLDCIGTLKRLSRADAIMDVFAH